MQSPVNDGDETAANTMSTNGAGHPPEDDVSDASNDSQPYMRATTLIASFGYAYQGMRYALRTQRNVKLHCVITLMVVVVGLLLGVSLDQWAALAVVVGLVFQTELTNTAVEAIVDRVSPEYHTLAKVAKDCSAAAVLITAMAAAVVGLLIFGPRLLALFHIA